MATPTKNIKCPICGSIITVNADEPYGTSHTCPGCGRTVYNNTNPQPKVDFIDNITNWASNQESSNPTEKSEQTPEPKNKISEEKVKEKKDASNTIEFKKEYKPNIYAVLSAVFCLFLPWIIGYPFGVVGDNRAKYLGDITGHRMAMIGKIVSIVMMALYGIGLIVSLWINDWRWGLPALFGVLVVYGVYFGIALYFHKHNS